MRGIKNKLLRRRSGSLAASEPASGISASSSTSSSSSSPSPITGASMSTESDAEEFNVASKTKPISITRRFPKADSVVQSPTAGSITIVKSPHIRTISATPGARSPASPFKFFSKHKIVTYRPKPYNLVRPPKASDPKGTSSSSSSSSSSKTLGNSSGAGGTGRPSNLTDYTKLFPPDKITQKMPFSSNTSFTSVDAHSWKQPPKSDTFTKISKRRKPVRWLTEGLLTTYGRCHTRFVFKPPFPVPKRTLTEPSASKHNGGADNENYDLIMHVGDTLGSAAVGGQAGLLAGSRYTILGSLGQGTFGQVVKCRDEVQGRLVAVKVLKNRPAYYKQGLLEVGILTAVNTNCDPTKKHCCLRVLDHFLFFNHLCIVTELLSMNIYELIKQGNFRGLNVRLVRALLKQVLYAMIALDREHIVHCDLKPENILLDQPREARITLIDFGSACYEHSTLYTYIQSRHYRAPEVILGLQYSTAIDMWSLGCIAAELVLGIPIFPGANEYNQLYKITQMLGPVPSCMIEKGAKGARFYKADSAVMGRYVLKTPAEYERDTGLPIPEDKRYVKYKSLEELARCVNIRTIAGDGTNVPEVRRSLLSFLSAILVIDPTKRLTPAQAFEHPFITGKPLPEDYTPPPRESPPPPITEYKRHDKSSLKLRAPPSETYATFCRNIFEDHKFVDIATGVTLCLLKDPLVPARELIIPDPVESMFLTSGSSILDNSERRQSGLRYTYSSSSVTVKHIPKTPITASAKQPKPTIASLSTSLTASSSLESAHNHHHHRHHHHHHHNHNHNHGDNSNSSNNSSGHNSKLATPLAATAESPTHRNLQKDPLDDVPQTRPRVRSSAPRPKHQSIILSPTIGPVNPAKASSSSSLKPKGSDHESSPPPLPKYPQGLSSPQPIAENKSGSAVHLPSLLGSMSVNCDEKAYDIDEDDDEFDVVDLAK